MTASPVWCLKNWQSLAFAWQRSRYRFECSLPPCLVISEITAWGNTMLKKIQSEPYILLGQEVNKHTGSTIKETETVCLLCHLILLSKCCASVWPCDYFHLTFCFFHKGIVNIVTGGIRHTAKIIIHKNMSLFYYLLPTTYTSFNFFNKLCNKSMYFKSFIKAHSRLRKNLK